VDRVTDCTSGTNLNEKGTWGRSIRNVAGITILTLKGLLFEPADVPESTLVTPSWQEYQPPRPEQLHLHAEGEYQDLRESDQSAVSSRETRVESYFGMPIESLAAVNSGFVMPMDG
jgi:hypothetical protein